MWGKSRIAGVLVVVLAIFFCAYTVSHAIYKGKLRSLVAHYVAILEESGEGREIPKYPK